MNTTKCYKIVKVYPDGSFGPGWDGCDNHDSIHYDYFKLFPSIFSLRYKVGEWVKPNFGRICVFEKMGPVEEFKSFRSFKIFECEGKDLSYQYTPLNSMLIQYIMFDEVKI